MKLIVVFEDQLRTIYWIDNLIDRLSNEKTQVIRCSSQTELNSIYRQHGKKMNYAKIIVLNSMSEAPISIVRLNDYFQVNPKTVLLWPYMEQFDSSWWLHISRAVYKLSGLCSVVLNEPYIIDKFYSSIPKNSMMNVIFTSYPVIYPNTGLKVNKSNSIAIHAPEYMLHDIEQISIILSKETGYTVTPLSIPGKLCDGNKFMQFVNECKILIDLHPVSWLGESLIQVSNRDCIAVTEKIGYGYFARNCVHDLKYHIDVKSFNSIPDFVTALPSIKHMVHEIIQSYDSIISENKSRIDRIVETCFNPDKFIETL